MLLPPPVHGLSVLLATAPAGADGDAIGAAAIELIDCEWKNNRTARKQMAKEVNEFLSPDGIVRDSMVVMIGMVTGLLISLLIIQHFHWFVLSKPFD